MYARLFHDPLEFFADALETTPPAADGPVVAGVDLVAGRGLDAVLQCYARSRAIHERRAIATDWSKFFFARLIIPVLVVQTGTGRQLDLDPAHWRMHCQADGTIARFVFTREPLTPVAAPGNMNSLIDDVMTPLIATLAKNCGLSPRVFASNAAMYYAWALDQLDTQNHTLPSARRPARALLDSPRRPDGGFNPFDRPFKRLAAGARDGNGEPVRRCRRLCCVRDLDPALPLCANCPRAITYVEANAIVVNGVS